MGGAWSGWRWVMERGGTYDVRKLKYFKLLLQSVSNHSKSTTNQLRFHFRSYDDESTCKDKPR